MRANPFTRPTTIAAMALLKKQNQASFDQMVLRLCLENEVSPNSDVSLLKKCGLIGRIVVERPLQIVETIDGNVTLSEAVIREAVKLIEPGLDCSDQTDFLRGLARDGYTISIDDNGKNSTLRMALPNEIDLPETDNEVQGFSSRVNLMSHMDTFAKRLKLTHAVTGPPPTRNYARL